jgi:phosphoribosylanthranilate isomerase
MSTLVKICGIKEPETAYQAAEFGADFIGLMFYKKSKRYVELDLAVEIANQARHGGSRPVAVFVDADADHILEVCAKTGITFVQLHGDVSRAAQDKLPSFIHRMYVVQIDAEGGAVQTSVPELQPLRDFLLFDGCEGGSGKAINLKNVKTINGLRFFLAGGLNANNVSKAIKAVQPYAVDVSSGVESAPGKKDLQLIKQFIEKVKQL